MEALYDQILDSPSKDSYIGSYYQPPDRTLPSPAQPGLPAHSATSTGPQTATLHLSHTKPKVDSRAVVDALKTLQEKIGRLELERTRAERSYQQHEAQARHRASCHPAASPPETDNHVRKELNSQLQSAEARCKVLEKQLDYMRKMVENAKERHVLRENQVSLQKQQPSSSNIHSQQEKLEKLESDCLNLSRTQTLAETKLAILEQKLLKEEHERQLVQEKADKLQRDLDNNLQLFVPNSEELKPKKKAKKLNKKTSRQNEPRSPSGPRHTKIPFVAGTSTSPSHSVHANIQSILHMMKHHQPQLCERVSSLQRSGCGVKKSLHKDFSTCSTTFHNPDREANRAEQVAGSLSDLLLALQDELGQMSFEHQELVDQIDVTQHREQRQDLQRELERLVARMEEKGAQITKLRKHQQTVHKLTQSQPCAAEPTAKKRVGIKPPLPSPVKAKQKGKKGATTHNNLQLLRETQKFRSSLKQDDLSWET